MSKKKKSKKKKIKIGTQERRQQIVESGQYDGRFKTKKVQSKKQKQRDKRQKRVVPDGDDFC